MNPFEIIWTAPEFEHRPKTNGWYWTSIVLAVVLLAFAVWQKNFLFALFIIIAEILVIIWGDREPAMVNFKIDHKGIYVAERHFYPHAHILSFSYIDHDHTEWADVVFHLHRRFQPTLKLHFPKNRLKELQGDLTNIVPLVVHEESTLDLIERMLGF